MVLWIGWLFDRYTELLLGRI